MSNYDELKLEELRDLASDRDLEGRSGLNKQELIDALAADDENSSEEVVEKAPEEVVAEEDSEVTEETQNPTVEEEYTWNDPRTVIDFPPAFPNEEV
jgi:hypothetical protein